MFSFVSVLTKTRHLIPLTSIYSRYLGEIISNRKMSSNASGILRTPDSAFTNLLDYPYKPNYIELANSGSIGDGKTKVRLHYLDEGNQKSKETLLLLHGEPSWSYLYRHFIPLLKQYRVVVPDLIGFGKSDKPAKKSDYTYQRHVNWIKQFIQDLNLNQITLFCQVKISLKKISNEKKTI